MTLLPEFGNVILTLISFVVALSIIVGVHEYGHYIVGRWSGIKAETFSIGFGPVLWARKDRHGTKWQIAAIPFGGYVKFLGDANAASGKDGEAMEAMPESELRHTMHGAPLWARSATVLAGPVFNFIFSILVFAGLLLAVGLMTNPPKISTLYPLPYEGITIEEGDQILAIAGNPYPEEPTREYFDALPDTLLLDYTVMRDGEQMTVKGPQYSPARIGMVQPRSAGEAAGLLAGDVILRADGEELENFGELVSVVKAADGGPVRLNVWRTGEEKEFVIQPELRDVPTADNGFEKRFLIGISSATFFEPVTERPGVFEAVGLGVKQTYSVVERSISGLYHLAAGKISSCNMSGAIGIARASKDQAEAGLVEFIGFLALLSTAVGFLNLLPIPMLDGGHLVFYAYEAVMRKKPSDKAMNFLMSLGMALVLSVMVFALWNDIFC
ncbi:RIP metalloprotease RseP [Lentibacter sp. XHP0401]|jgi:regulator of sigma E protease|uniref:RIP metalloprotease RseP n=1 Tax=Lentibacter sp. XHP0401 TaxID=2984334 RepID=UPI0021E81C42|nr:RIP metalloprotease RseP [Lentibacter sp. XHP0401]MCV2892148.1 RIP metalloprotease RseP [Lentibacter sp. XHP0401]